MKKILLTLTSLAAVSLVGLQAQVAISGNYTQNFDSLSSGLPSNWAVLTGATVTSMGTSASANYTSTNSTLIGWANTTAGFKNFASSTGLTSASTSTQQFASTNRVLGIRPTDSFGDSGASISFNFSTLGYAINSISFEAHMLYVQNRSQTWSLQYGLGTSPTSFVTLGTWEDPGIWGITTFTYDRTNFTSNLDNQQSVYFRFVGLSASTGANNRDSVGIDNFSISAESTAVPEPSTWALIGLGSAFVLWRMWRKSPVS
jgi:hypothetical protein